LKTTIYSLHKQEGQGLIEILVVAVIVIISSLSLMQFQASLSYKDSLALQRSDATILALTEIESLRDFQVLTTQTPYTAYSNIASGSSTVTGYNATFTITWTVTTTATPAYKVLDVLVTWNDIRGVAQTIHLTSNVAGIVPVFSATVMY
jgi:Tfp pilus assembly protein PilV